MFFFLKKKSKTGAFWSFRFNFWRVVKRLTQHLTRARNFDSKCKMKSCLKVDLKCNAFYFFRFKTWRVVKIWVILIFFKKFGFKKRVLFQSCFLRNLLFQETAKSLFLTFKLFEVTQKWSFDRKVSNKNWFVENNFGSKYGAM